MISVIFEVWPGAERRNQYFDLAAALRPELERIDGFISIERFESLTEPGKILSLSFWRDDEQLYRDHVVQLWRNERLLPLSRACSFGEFDRYATDPASHHGCTAISGTRLISAQHKEWIVRTTRARKAPVRRVRRGWA